MWILLILSFWRLEQFNSTRLSVSISSLFLSLLCHFFLSYFSHFFLPHFSHFLSFNSFFPVLRKTLLQAHNWQSSIKPVFNTNHGGNDHSLKKNLPSSWDSYSYQLYILAKFCCIQWNAEIRTFGFWRKPNEMVSHSQTFGLVWMTISFGFWYS